jgi:hypothetical protein
LGVEIQVPSIDLGDSLSAATEPSSLLSELRALRRGTSRLNSRGLTHLFTGRDLDGTTVGIAYLDSLCDREFGAGLSEARNRSAWIESLIAAHEIGHNFGAVHDGDPDEACASAPAGFLMATSINGSDQFSTCSLGLMRPNIATASCIAPLSTADISVASDLGAVQRPLSRAFDWDLTVSNVGGLPTVNATAHILVPPVLSVEEVFVVGGTCTSGAGVIQCRLGEIAGGNSTVVHLSLRSDVIGSNSISVDVSADNETRTNNNRGDGTISIEPETDLAIGLQAPSTTTAGGGFSLSISASNLSQTTAASSVTVTVSLPAGVTATAASLDGGSCSIAVESISCSLPSLAAGATVSGTASMSASSIGSAVVAAQISGGNPDSVEDNNSAQATLTVASSAVISGQASPSGGGGGGGSSNILLLSALLGLLGWQNLQRRRALIPH